PVLTATPTATPVLPTTTPVPPTATPILPTTTPAPPSATPPPTTAPLSPTATPCAIAFSDVQPGDYFYEPAQYLACQGVIAGYTDGTFRPYNLTTRAQMVKIVVLGFGLPIHTPAGDAATFADVPPEQPFFAVIETAAAAQVVSGYACGGPGE